MIIHEDRSPFSLSYLEFNLIKEMIQEFRMLYPHSSPDALALDIRLSEAYDDLFGDK